MAQTLIFLIALLLGGCASVAPKPTPQTKNSENYPPLESIPTTPSEETIDLKQ